MHFCFSVSRIWTFFCVCLSSLFVWIVSVFMGAFVWDRSDLFLRLTWVLSYWSSTSFVKPLITFLFDLYIVKKMSETERERIFTANMFTNHRTASPRLCLVHAWVFLDIVFIFSAVIQTQAFHVEVSLKTFIFFANHLTSESMSPWMNKITLLF